MDWSSPFIVYRVNEDGKLEEVFHAQDIKKAKYWLTYIAQTGDVLCRTPVHPKHSGGRKSAEYWCHKEQTGQPSSEEKAWRQWLQSHTPCCEIVFPDEQLKTPE